MHLQPARRLAPRHPTSATVTMGDDAAGAFGYRAPRTGRPTPVGPRRCRSATPWRRTSACQPTTRHPTPIGPRHLLIGGRVDEQIDPEPVPPAGDSSTSIERWAISTNAAAHVTFTRPPGHRSPDRRRRPGGGTGRPAPGPAPVSHEFAVFRIQLEPAPQPAVVTGVEHERRLTFRTSVVTIARPWRPRRALLHGHGSASCARTPATATGCTPPPTRRSPGRGATATVIANAT